MKFSLLILLTISQCVLSQELRPYPQARITEAQWQSYYEQVKAKYGGSSKLAPNQPLLIFDDGHSTLYAFTQPGHPAHPSWIARKVVQDSKGIYIDQVGYFAGDEGAFAALFKAYRALDANVREYVKSQGERKRE